MQSAKWSLLIEKWSKTNANRWWFTSRAVTNKLFFRQKPAFFRNRTFCSQSIAGIRQNVINHYQVNRQHNTGYYILKVFSSWWEKILTIVRKNTHHSEKKYSCLWEYFLIAVRIFSHFGENRSVCTNLLMVNYSFTTQFYSFPSQEGANKAFLSIFESLLNKIEKESEHG